MIDNLIMTNDLSIFRQRPGEYEFKYLKRLAQVCFIVAKNKENHENGWIHCYQEK